MRERHNQLRELHEHRQGDTNEEYSQGMMWDDEEPGGMGWGGASWQGMG